MAQRIRSMTEGSPIRLLISFALPLMVGNVFQQLYTVVDTAVVGQVVARLCKDAGESALAYTVELAARAAVLAAALPALGRLLKYLGEIAAL